MASSYCLLCRRYVHGSNKQVKCRICSQKVHAGCMGVVENCSTYVYYCKCCLSEALPFNNISNDELCEQLCIPYDSLRQLMLQYKNLRLELYDFDEHNNFASASDIDADSNHFNMFSHINDYYDVQNLNKCLPASQSVNLQSILHLNINNLVTKFDVFYTNLQLIDHKFSIIAFTETATNSETENWVDIPGYSKIIKNRVINMKGGGVAMYFNNDLKISWKVRQDLSLKDSREMESLFVQIKQSNLSVKEIIVGVIYRPPNTDFDVFYDSFSDILVKINAEKRPTYLLGDFNIDLLKYNKNQKTQKFLNLLLSNGFYPRIDKPTRITDSTATLIDNIFVNVHTDSIVSGPWLVDISDHLPIYTTLPYELNNRKVQTKYITKRRYDDKSMLAFKTELLAVDWSNVLLNYDLNSKFNTFMYTFSNLHNKYFPPVKMKIKNDSIFKPWITPAIKNSVKKKNNLFKKYVNEKSVNLKRELHEKYKKYRNKLTSIIRVSEKQYYQNKLFEVKENMSKTWKVLNSMLYRNAKHDKIDEMDINGVTENDPKNIANKFNEFFTNIGPNLAKQIPKSNLSAGHFLKGDFQNSFFTSPVTNEEISSIILALKNTNSKGYDDIPVNLVKYCGNELSYILAHISNASLTTGVFPDALKLAKIVPIFKNGSKKVVSNYRPISVLSAFSKIFERIMYTRLDNYLDINDILHQSQFGFRKKLSTSMALLELTEEISKSIDDRNYTVGVFIDLAKAFDTVDHKILLQKLHHYGVRGTANEWFGSYLENRRQFVVVNGTPSGCSTISCGVPQGSILGPLLFILYINDLNTISKKLRTIMFADDTNLFMTGKNLDEIKIQLNEELKIFSLWFQANLLSLNISKTSYIVFSKGLVSSQTELFIQTVQIERVLETKFLGVIISHKLSWKSHITGVCSKMAKNTGIIAKVRHLLPRSQVRLLYLTLVQPYMN